MHMPLSYLERKSMFVDYFVPGLILGGLFGVGSLIVAAMGLLACGPRRSWLSSSAADR